MGIYLKLIWLALYMSCFVIDIVFFLILWRFISTSRCGPWSERLKKRGEALLDSFNAVVGRLWYRATQKHLSKKGQFVAAMLLLFVGQLVLSGIARLL